MKSFFWNARGLANASSRLVLKRLVNIHKPDILLIAEPWMNIDNLPKRWLKNLDLKLFALNTRTNLLPNLWCFCKPTLQPTIIAFDGQHVSFLLNENDLTFAFSAVYASTNYQRRRHLWSTLNSLQSHHNFPWCFMGDFNAIIGAHEHRGSFSPARLPMSEFSSWSESNSLYHIPTRGSSLTWTNGRRGNRNTQRRLDRSICNQQWLDMCCSLSCSTLTKIKSNHFPLLLEFQVTPTTFASQFKFQQMWSLHPDCKDIVTSCWNTNFTRCPMFILSAKLKHLKSCLKQWNKEVFGDINSEVKSAEDKLDQIQSDINLLGPNDDLLDAEIVAQSSLDTALTKQEIFWKQKANLNWHLEGDRNTKYFHKIAKIKTSSKLITTWRDGEHTFTNTQQISTHIINYYKSLFCSNFVLQEQHIVEEVIPNIITDEINDLLTILPSIQEVKAVVFSLNKESAPGPDGFGEFFFQTYWSIVHQDVMKAVLEFFTKGWILPGYNSNTIALIPKIPNATSIDQYRPIAMANFKFKIITKIIADRLSQLMPVLISKEQKGFIHGRNIRDCLCTASEAANLLLNKSYGGNLILKIDISKAFDTLEWPFLLKVLKTFGFNETFCNWIDVILKSAFLSISVNGKAQGFFNYSRGVRQGDPLSPLLFCIAEDVLSRGISKLVMDGKLNLIKGTRKIQVPSHSFYADDLMVYCKGNISGLEHLKDLFKKYALDSGQMVSTSK